MTSYHGWTHLPKDQGGTDPIPGFESSGAIDLSVVGRRYFAPRIVAGVPVQHFDSGAGEPWEVPQGYSIWPGGLVVQAMEPFRVGADVSATSVFNNVHLADLSARCDHHAASQVAAEVSFEFTPEQIGLDTSGRTQYEPIYVFKVPTGEDTATLHIDHTGTNSTGNDLATLWDRSIASTSVYQGTDYFVTYQGPNQEYTPAAGDQIQMKVWFEGGDGAEFMFFAAIYWLPIASLAYWGDGVIADGQNSGWVTDIADRLYTGATAGDIAGSTASYMANAMEDTQRVDGLADAGYSISVGGLSLFPSDGFYWGSSLAGGRHSMALGHDYVECRLNMNNESEFDHGFITRYQDTMIDDQAYIETGDWSLVYLGPRTRWSGTNCQLGFWLPLDGGNFFWNLEGQDAASIQFGALFNFFDFLTRQTTAAPWGNPYFA